MPKKKKKNETVTSSNLPELYLSVHRLLDDYYSDTNPNKSQAECSAIVKTVFPQMRDNRIHKAISAMQVNTGLSPNDPEYVHFCPKCLIEWIHEAEFVMGKSESVESYEEALAE